ncbi:hypothetical protein NIIDMKKI_02270 [Mycobacterium kansasii]|uniref:Putative a/G-specific adenine glycosylase n=1 Tax=Mycobacterium kansasii TaxID=1768 RepID=A0A1V3XAC2_MYCKA|nr:putative a/G-specific adenine glycosylase [Mycobacterium kansasii]BCI85021.1 hypothetical protein NIIDMKKI_02270 [Mycobacterium kansasii]
MSRILPYQPVTAPQHIPSANLLAWYERSRRDLPWRRPDVGAWQILVSEFMLQQTPVSRVLSIWPDWVRRWPTASATAAATAADVLRAWGSWATRAGRSGYTNAPPSSRGTTVTWSPTTSKPW